MEIETRMSIEEINMADENIVEIEISEAFPFTTDGILDEAFEDKYVLLDGGTLNDIHSSTVKLDDVLETCATLGGQDNSHHGALDGRDQPNQHPIEAIEGLREELDEIEALQTIYSNESGLANYYLWEDGNQEKENRFGYFVSKLSNNKIKIIENKDEDVFGVVTDIAAFVGGQADTPRNYQYGLIVYTGEAVVRCESDVKIGDCVTTNDVGIAQKTTSGHGYRVSATSKTNDFHYYATISLDVSAHQLDALGTDIDNLESRMDDAETNITTANTLASTAYQLAKAANTGDIGALNASTVAKAEEALDKAENALANTEYFNAQIQSAVQSATQAKTIAANAVTSATSMKNEAVAKSNQALSEVSTVRAELEANVANINKELDDAAEELKQTQENLSSARDELQGSIDESKQSFEALETELTPLVEHPDGGVAGFVARADEDSLTIASLVTKTDGTNEALSGFKQEVANTYATTESLNKFKTENSEALASMKQEATDTYATIKSLNSFKAATSEAITGVKQEVSDNYAKIDSVASLKTETSEALTGFKQEAAETYATQEMLSSLETNTSKALADYKTEVAENYATQKMLTNLETETSKALTDYQQTVTETYATQEMVTKYEQEANKALTDYKQEVSKDYATQQMLTDLETNTTKALSDYKTEVTNTYAKTETLNSFKGEMNTALNTLTQKSDANGAYIQGFVANIDKYSYGKYSQANRFTYEEALNILEPGMVFVPSETPSEPEIYAKTTDDYPEMKCTFTKGFSYTWGEAPENQRLTWNGSAVQDVVFSVEYQVGGAFTYWVATDNCKHEGVSYEKDCLYKWENELWIKVATLQGNLSAVTTSILKQTSNSLELAITNVNESYAGLKEQVDENSVDIQEIARWSKDGEGKQYSLATIQSTANDAGASIAQIVENVGDDGKVTAASIITSVNNDKSGVTINADHIQFDGFVSFANKSEVEAVQKTVVSEVKVEYALSDSETEAPAEEDWSTTAPEHQENMHMWQRTTITKGDGTSASTTTCIQGAKGNDGEPGGSGATVASTVTQFYLSTSSETQLGGSWSTTPAAWEKDSYMWTREQYTLTDETIVYSEPMLDNTFTTISSWCNSTDMTLIDGANIATGTLTAEHIKVTDLSAFKASIGGWIINDDLLVSENGTVGLFSADYDGQPADEFLRDSLVSEGMSTVRFFAGAPDSAYISNSAFMVLNDGSLYANAAKLGSGNLGELNSIFLNTTDMAGVDGFFNGKNTNNWRLTVGSHFGVTSDGILYAKNGSFTGTITANKGTVGGLGIEEDGSLCTSNFKILNEMDSDTGNFYSTLKLSDADGNDSTTISHDHITAKKINCTDIEVNTITAKNIDTADCKIGNIQFDEFVENIDNQDVIGQCIYFGDIENHVGFYFVPGTATQYPVFIKIEGAGTSSLGNNSLGVRVTAKLCNDEGSVIAKYNADNAITVTVRYYAVFDGKMVERDVVIRQKYDYEYYYEDWAWGIKNWSIVRINGNSVSLNQYGYYPAGINGVKYTNPSLCIRKKENGILSQLHKF